MKKQNGTGNSFRADAAFAFLGLIGAGIIVATTSRYGAGISPDSVLYIQTARDLEEGIGIQGLTISPPLYPILLAVLGFFFRKDPIAVTNIINGVIFGFTIFFSGIYFNKHLQSISLSILGSLLVLISVPLSKVFLMAWTEPPFILLVVLFLISLECYLETKKLALLLLISLCAILASLTRYIGILLIPIGLLSIGLSTSGSPNNKKVFHLFLYFLVSTLPIGLWTVKNYLYSGTYFGARSLSTYSYYDNLVSTFGSFLSWYLPERIRDNREFRIVLGVFLVLITIRGFSDRRLKDAIKSVINPTILFVVVYIGFLLISSRTSFLQPIDNRYLSPVFIPVTLLFLFLLKELVSHFGVYSHQFGLSVLLWIFIALGMVYPSRNLVLSISNHIQNGAGYTSKDWRQSQTLQYLSTNNVNSECEIYSNGGDVIYLAINLRVKPVPAKRLGAVEIADISSLKKSFPVVDKTCIVWFNQITWRTYLFSPEELISITKLQKVNEFDDGTIYVVSKE